MKATWWQQDDKGNHSTSPRVQRQIRIAQRSEKKNFVEITEHDVLDKKYFERENQSLVAIEGDVKPYQFSYNEN